MNKKIALFIGRFQPFHNGHLSVLKNLENNPEISEIIIGVGSSQYSNTDDNPYSYQDREIMIKKSINGIINKPFKVIAIDDIHNDTLWVNHVKKIIGEFDEIYTGNDRTKKLFIAKNYTVRDVVFKTDISGTKLRGMIKNEDKNWEKYVSKQTAEIINQEN